MTAALAILGGFVAVGFVGIIALPRLERWVLADLEASGFPLDVEPSDVTR